MMYVIATLMGAALLMGCDFNAVHGGSEPDLGTGRNLQAASEEIDTGGVITTFEDMVVEETWDWHYEQPVAPSAVLGMPDLPEPISHYGEIFFTETDNLDRIYVWTENDKVVFAARPLHDPDAEVPRTATITVYHLDWDENGRAIPLAGGPEATFTVTVTNSLPIYVGEAAYTLEITADADGNVVWPGFWFSEHWEDPSGDHVTTSVKFLSAAASVDLVSGNGRIEVLPAGVSVELVGRGMYFKEAGEYEVRAAGWDGVNDPVVEVVHFTVLDKLAKDETPRFENMVVEQNWEVDYEQPVAISTVLGEPTYPEGDAVMAETDNPDRLYVWTENDKVKFAARPLYDSEIPRTATVTVRFIEWDDDGRARPRPDGPEGTFTVTVNNSPPIYVGEDAYTVESITDQYGNVLWPDFSFDDLWEDPNGEWVTTSLEVLSASGYVDVHGSELHFPEAGEFKIRASGSDGANDPVVVTVRFTVK